MAVGAGAKLGKENFAAIKVYAVAPPAQDLYVMGREDGKQGWETAFRPQNWHHLCLSYDGLSKTINGVLVS